MVICYFAFRVPVLQFKSKSTLKQCRCFELCTPMFWRNNVVVSHTPTPNPFCTLTRLHLFPHEPARVASRSSKSYLSHSDLAHRLLGANYTPARSKTLVCCFLPQLFSFFCKWCDSFKEKIIVFVYEIGIFATEFLLNEVLVLKFRNNM